MEISRYFTAQEVIALTSISYRQLDYWVRIGVIRASGRSNVRRGCPRLFTFKDVIEIRVALKLLDNGLKLSALKSILKSVRKRLGEIDAPLAGEKLVTDGKNLFRFIHDINALESYDEFGQLAFTFGFGEEAKGTIEEIRKLPVPSRYRRIG